MIFAWSRFVCGRDFGCQEFLDVIACSIDVCMVAIGSGALLCQKYNFDAYTSFDLIFCRFPENWRSVALDVRRIGFSVCRRIFILVLRYAHFVVSAQFCFMAGLVGYDVRFVFWNVAMPEK